jgi:predicted RNase H-like nuclease (RuvC/YqgF family)
VETVQEKAKCEASENKQLKRRLEEHSQEIESLELYIEKLENSINISTQVLENIQIQEHLHFLFSSEALFYYKHIELSSLGSLNSFS